MECPVCKGVNLVMTERQGIEIDYCPQCRGVWLDRGELDKIIDRSIQIFNAGQDGRFQTGRYEQEHYREHRDRDDSKYYGHDYKKKKRGLLGDIFDFD